MEVSKIILSSIFISCFCLTSCINSNQPIKEKRFRQLSAESTGIQFTNQLAESDSLNYFTYQYMYMGGGVAIGDINNDGLSDIFFTGNMVENKLYLNKGNLKFKDISSSANINGNSKWYTGVSFVDINSDGYMDIYLSVSGKAGDKKNELYINNGDLTFTERAHEYGIDDDGQSIQSAFFDYDHDGDLDLLVINYPITDFKTPNTVYRMMMNNPDYKKSDHLFRNEGNGHFVDVTQISGLLNFGLSVGCSIGDFNQDGWDDVYISNDFSTPDYFYINNGDGTFTDKLKESTKQTAFYGMGIDAEDINNDGLLDLFQTDMAAADNRRSKANMASMNIGLFWSTVYNGFHYQYMYNSLQLNQGIDNNGLPVFSNIGFMSGVASTDWSWAPLLADFDNDGRKDLFITNGTRREINNKDYFNNWKKNKNKGIQGTLLEQVEEMPSEKIDNYIFKNIDGLKFKKVNEEWGLSFEGFSNGAAYGDLDNDGDLDLVINNIDNKSVIFENRTSNMDAAGYLKIVLKTNEPNKMGIGAKVTAIIGENKQYLHLNPSKGFQSYVEPILHLGLGENEKVDSLIVTWTDGTKEVMVNVNSNQTVLFQKGRNEIVNKKDTKSQPMFHEVTKRFDSVFVHTENHFNDFKNQVLLPHKLSNLGPALAIADVNGDQLDDIYIGNGAGFAGKLYYQNSEGQFILSKDIEVWEQDAMYEDVGAVFFDANNDGFVDLYVVSGGNEFEEDKMYQDRLYLNFNGTFIKSKNVLPSIKGSGSKVLPKDFDGDGDIDLFVGGRLSPHNYPYAGQSYILVNQLSQGEFEFIDKTEDLAPGLSDIGMVTDALWTDLDQNGTTDLMVTGEWMPLTIFSQNNGKFKNETSSFGLDDTVGWWFSIDGADFDNDGDMDFIVGNLGLNYKYQASPEETFDIYANDFDQNGSLDLVLGYHNLGKEYPVRGRQCSSQQIPAIQIKFKDYASFANATVEDIYGKEDLEKSLHYQAKSFSSVYLENQGKGVFKRKELPFLAQISPINDMVIEDFNFDGNLDVLIAGNLYASEVETPRSDAGIGLILLGDGHGGFDPLSYALSGINMSYDVKAIGLIKSSKQFSVVVANNQGPLQLFSTLPKDNSKLPVAEDKEVKKIK